MFVIFVVRFFVVYLQKGENYGLKVFRSNTF